MTKRCVSVLLVLCLLLTLAACGGKKGDEQTPATSATTTTTTTTKPITPDDPVTPTLTPTFAAMPAMTRDMAEVYRLDEKTVLFAFITPGMDSSLMELACYDLSADTLLGEVNLGERWASVFPVDATSFAVLDYDRKTYTVYNTACAEQSTVTLAFEGAIGSAEKNGDRLLLSDLFTGQYYVYDLATQAATPVDATVSVVEYACVGGYKDGFLLYSYDNGLLTVAPDGQKQLVSSATGDAQVVGNAYTAGVVGDYAVFHSLTGGDAVMTPVRGEAETFCSADGNGLLSRSQSEQGGLYYYDLHRRTVADYAVDGTVVDAALWGTSAVAVVRTAYGEPLTFVYVDFAALTPVGMDAAAYDKTVVDDLRPLPAVSGVAAEILDAYGVTVIGRHDFFDMSPYGFVTTAATSEQIAARTEQLQDFLAYFPEGLFKELSEKAPVVIVLCDDVGGTAGGLNTLMDGYNVTMLGVGGYDSYFLGVAAHELGHAIERGVSLADLDGWMAMQPVEVQAAYGNLNLTVEYTADDKGKTPVWFTDAYGRTNAMEDRATVFEEMYGAWVTGDASTLNYDGLKQKVAFWSRMLRSNFTCCADATFPWDNLFE